MASHEQFEELAALAALGELSGNEWKVLKEHERECDFCRRTGAAFFQICHTDLPALHQESKGLLQDFTNVISRSRRERRFLQQATRQGFHFSSEIGGSETVSGLASSVRPSYVLLAVLCLVLGALAVRTFDLRNGRATSTNNADVERQAADLIRERDRLIASLQDAENAQTVLKSKVNHLEGNEELARQSVAMSAQQRDVVAAESQKLRSDLEAEEAKSSLLSARLVDDEKRLTELTSELRSAGSDHTADSIIIANQQKQLEDTATQLKAQAEALNREQELLSAGRDIRELMGARNLHIIDVFDTDMRGSNQRAFGRVFYTEGKSLIFYAFDLTNGNEASSRHSFQAWGLRDGVKQTTKSLGIFYVDDAALKRWILKIENPNVLDQIDSVFVTIEPFGGASKPTGHKLLYAYLKNQPNHP